MARVGARRKSGLLASHEATHSTSAGASAGIRGVGCQISPVASTRDEVFSSCQFLLDPGHIRCCRRALWARTPSCSAKLRVVKLQELALTAYYLDPNAYTRLWMDAEIRMKPILENLQQK